MGFKKDIAIKSLKAVKASDFKTKAKRPLNSLLDNSKLEKALGFELPSWEKHIEEEIKEIILNSF